MYLISVLRGNTKNYKNRKTHQKCCDWIFSAFFLFLSIFITWIMHMSNLSDKFLFKKFPFFHNAKKKFLAWKNFENREVSNKSVCQGKLLKKKVRDITAIGYSRVVLRALSIFLKLQVLPIVILTWSRNYGPYFNGEQKEDECFHGELRLKTPR